MRDDHVRPDAPVEPPRVPVASPVVNGTKAPPAPPALEEKVEVRSLDPKPNAADRARDDVRERVMTIVAEQTGYAVDMLDPELDLEADLGIDTVKQAEMFVAVREAFTIQRDPSLQLRDYNTLEKVVRFVMERRPDLQAKLQDTPTSMSASDAIRDKVLAIVSNQTGYAVDMLDPELDLEADLGIDTVKQAEMFVAVREAFGIAREANLQLRDYNTLDKVVSFVRERRPELSGAVAPAAAGPRGPSQG
ncbi:MAG: hypothetical protein HC923_00600 [Myxococcales bacterium]|nr:hypothetical protein [Myxococcales bacterium]